MSAILDELEQLQADRVANTKAIKDVRERIAQEEGYPPGTRFLLDQLPGARVEWNGDIPIVVTAGGIEIVNEAHIFRVSAQSSSSWEERLFAVEAVAALLRGRIDGSFVDEAGGESP